ncbi:unnamed protein product [marine sediment metagenome]|uniref:Uncharacterized protein n=1 Tax=marine sediment metagenome TaxID=412755 RepID=X1U610_9ZZZZ
MPTVKDIPGFGEIGLYPTDKRIDLYRVTGLAPTYDPQAPGIGIFENVTMNWWVPRTIGFKIDYPFMLNGNVENNRMLAINQLFLLREAELFKEWIDGLYPEENTTITQVEVPIKEIACYPADFRFATLEGSFWCNHIDWQYDLKICSYIDLSKCKEIERSAT